MVAKLPTSLRQLQEKAMKGSMDGLKEALGIHSAFASEKKVKEHLFKAAKLASKMAWEHEHGQDKHVG